MLGAGEIGFVVPAATGASISIGWLLLIALVAVWIVSATSMLLAYARHSREYAPQQQRADEERDCADQILIFDAHRVTP